ncbi:aspartyl protease family protein [Croceibacterium sp. TMG7-5b_MA50]|uniref:aspartyl protease family protein n=1 Tax=Croceibacterium sp. TMG7-5b_MA50 TaxID=3121290 RepID=UPI003221C1EB
MMMRLDALVGAVLLAGAASAAMAQAPQAGQEVPSSPAIAGDRPTRAPDKPAAMPFELRDNLVVIGVTINGRPQAAVLDSGAGAVVIDQRLTAALGLAADAPGDEIAGGGAAAQQSRLVDIATLDIGPLGFAHLPGHSADLAQLSASAGFPIDLLIGAPAFRHGSVRVDYAQRLVTFGSSGGTCAAPIPFTLVENVPVVEAELRPAPGAEPVRLKLVVDLGTRHRAAIIGGPFLRSAAGQALMAAGAEGKVAHGVGGTVEGGLARVAELRVGDVRFTGLEVALTSGAPVFETGLLDGSLGVPLWQAGAIVFDYPAGTLCIER